MKFYFTIVFFIAILASCKQTTDARQETMPEEMKSQAIDLTGFSLRNLNLINQLGSISIYLPVAMDTFFTYTDFGEYHCAETKQYRYASKKFQPVGIEDFSYSDATDSLLQFTIVQTYNKDCETNTAIDDGMLVSLQKDKTHKYSMLDVRGKKIIVGVNEFSKGEMSVAEVLGITTISGRMVKFVFQCFKKSADNFIEQAITSLKSLSVKENNS